jgi:prevent-host-death family protein
MNMQVLPALEVKSRFGRVSNIVKSGELVTITQHGEPTMVLFPLKLAQEVLKAYRTSGKKTNSQQDDGEGLLEWLEARTAKPAFDEELERQKIREMVAKELGIPVPKPSTREEALAAFDRWDEEARNRPLDPEIANMTDEEYEAMVAEEIKAVRAEKRAEESALIASH